LVRSGTSITMARDVLKWIDERVRERVFASRSHAFEYVCTFSDVMLFRKRK